MENLVNRQTILDKKNISEDLVTYIKQQILEGGLNPGDRIVETKVARELGISQTPVREAIRQLSGEGIITIVPNKGPMVHNLDMKDVFEVYSLRSMLEGLAIRLTTQHAPQEELERLAAYYEQMKVKKEDASVKSLLVESLYIHETIIYLANHSMLTSIYKSISFKILLINRLLGVVSTKQKEVEQHQELIDALLSRNPDQAEATMRKHIHRTYQEFKQLHDIPIPSEKTIDWFE